MSSSRSYKLATLFSVFRPGGLGHVIAGRTKLALAALAVILPAALAAYFIKSYSVNLLVLDEWELVERIDHWYAGTLTQ